MKTKKRPVESLEHLLACGHPIDALVQVAVFPGRRIVYRCAYCNNKEKQR